LGNGVSIFKQPIGKRTLTVVDMCNDAKITNVLHFEAQK
jgi:hypothetical protein